MDRDIVLLLLFPGSSALLAALLRNRPARIYWSGALTLVVVFSLLSGRLFALEDSTLADVTLGLFVNFAVPVFAAFGMRAFTWIRFYGFILWFAAAAAYLFALFVGLVLAENFVGLAH